ncbi:hypothetical protein G6F37_003352 [Rhizopus arrhizus]|nr:hypothetical protein G6F38_006879 [Rhizopus arrhizus]KAG1161124.1 hypothetical protein G6F37_003352 [Rhizopus arrhizus]
MFNNMEKLLVAVLLLTQEGETFCTVYTKILLLTHHAHIDAQSLVKLRWKKTKKYHCIYEAVKTQEVQNTEDIVVNSQSLDLQNFEEYLRNHALVTELLQRHYTETTTNHLTIHPLYRKLKLSKYTRRQKTS